MVYFLKGILKTIRMLLAVCLILLGMVVTPLPIPSGILMIAIGVIWLMSESAFFRKNFYKTIAKWPFLDHQLDKIQDKLPPHLRRDAQN